MYAQNTESVGTIYGIFSFFWYATLGYFTAPEKHFMLRERQQKRIIKHFCKSATKPLFF